jgi:hypothetical protein
MCVGQRKRSDLYPVVEIAQPVGKIPALCDEYNEKALVNSCFVEEYPSKGIVRVIRRNYTLLLLATTAGGVIEKDMVS